jgi:hypothetical protein
LYEEGLFGTPPKKLKIMNDNFNHDQREQIMYDWYSKGVKSYKENNDFEAFIYLWISLVVACKIHYGNNIQVEKFIQKDLDDRKIILQWAEWKAIKIVEIVNRNLNNLKPLCNRKGSFYKNPIIDASKDLSMKFHNIQNFLNGSSKYTTEKEMAKDFIELINKVRNNLFHGNKTYDNENDRSLLAAILPLLVELTQFSVDTIH